MVTPLLRRSTEPRPVRAVVPAERVKVTVLRSKEVVAGMIQLELVRTAAWSPVAAGSKTLPPLPLDTKPEFQSTAYIWEFCAIDLLPSAPTPVLDETGALIA